VVGTACGYFGGEQEIRQTCERICISRANLVLVALGNPLQELWIARHGEASGATLLIGVGALFDFTVDRVHRAPPWLRRARCEWMYRLASEPRRLAGRYLLGNALFLASVLRDRRRSPP
jgi:alpha-1,3-mannosyltransferase